MAHTPDKPLVVVGSGPAGISAIQELRRSGFAGRITVIAEEGGEPYDRPPLSKQVLAGTWEIERARLLPSDRLEGLDATWIQRRAAVSLDTEHQIIVTDDGADYQYAAALIATGSSPRRLPDPGLTGIHVLRSAADALKLRSALQPGAELVIVGGGFLGLEVAATANTLGCRVTVVEPLEQPLANRVGDIVAERLVAVHRAHGVRVLCGLTVAGFRSRAVGAADPRTRASREDPVSTVVLSDQTELKADVVLIAIGANPRVEWLEGSGLEIDDGVVCDQYCRAAPNVWAAGDVARWFHIALCQHVRFEHRLNASEQGRAVARSILGAPTAFAPVPFFWTDQFDVKLQLCGVLPENSRMSIVEGSEDSGAFIAAFYATELERPSAVLSWNAAGKLAPYRAVLQEDADYARCAYEEKVSRGACGL